MNSASSLTGHTQVTAKGLRDQITLGPEILEGIFSYLSPGDLANAELVCKAWRKAVVNSSLWQSHLRVITGDAALCGSGSASRGNYKHEYLEVVASEHWQRGAVKVSLLRGHQGAVGCLSCTEDVVASGSVDGTVRVWDADRGRCLRVLRHNQEVVAVVWSSPLLLASATSRRVHLWNKTQCKRTITPPAHTTIRQLAASDLDCLLGLSDGSVACQDVYSGALRGIFRDHHQPVRALDVVSCGEGQVVVSGCDGGSVVGRDMRQEAIAWKVPGGSDGMAVGSVAYKRGCHQLYICYEVGRLVSFDVRSMRCALYDVRDAARAYGRGFGRPTCTFLPRFGSQWLLCGGWGGKVAVVDTVTGTCARQLRYTAAVRFGHLVGGDAPWAAMRDPSGDRRQWGPLQTPPLRGLPSVGITASECFSPAVLLRPDAQPHTVFEGSRGTPDVIHIANLRGTCETSDMQSRQDKAVAPNEARDPLPSPWRSNHQPRGCIDSPIFSLVVNDSGNLVTAHADHMCRSWRADKGGRAEG